MCPKKILICLGLIGGFRSMMTLILAMCTLIPSLQTTCPNRMPIGVANMHFFMFKEIWICLHLSNISLSHLMWSFSMLYIVQSSKYTPMLLYIYSWKALTTILENTAGAFWVQKAFLYMQRIQIHTQMLFCVDLLLQLVRGCTLKSHLWMSSLHVLQLHLGFHQQMVLGMDQFW